MSIGARAVHSNVEGGGACLCIEKMRLNAKGRPDKGLPLRRPPLVAQGGATTPTSKWHVDLLVAAASIQLSPSLPATSSTSTALDAAELAVADPPVIVGPISAPVPPDLISKTQCPPAGALRLVPPTSSTALSGTCASMVKLRSMQIAEPEHMSLVKSYVPLKGLPAATKILSIALSPTAAVCSAALLTESWCNFRPCSAMGAEGARPSVAIDPVGRLATAKGSWTRWRSVAALMCIWPCGARRVGRP